VAGGKDSSSANFSEATYHHYCWPPQNDTGAGIVIVSEAKNLRFQAGTEDPGETQDEYQTYFKEITEHQPTCNRIKKINPQLQNLPGSS
jgi:hypothetical protein